MTPKIQGRTQPQPVFPNPTRFLDSSKILSNWVFLVKATLEKSSKSKVELMVWLMRSNELDILSTVPDKSKYPSAWIHGPPGPWSQILFECIPLWIVYLHINRVQAVREVCAHAAIGTHDNVVRYFSAWSEGDRMLVSHSTQEPRVQTY